MKLDILAFAVHPDDAELGCTGTLLVHMALGKKAGIIDLTCGELGTRGSGPLRLIEAENAGKILGLSARENLGFRDGFFKNDEEHQLKIIQILRKYQPEIVLINAPEDRHPDHGRAGQLLVDSCFYSGLLKIETFDNKGDAQQNWRPRQAFHYIQDRYLKPSFVVDISEFWPTKMKAMQAFNSQFFQPNAEGVQSYISNKDFSDFIEARAREMGHASGFTFGEGFITNKTLGVKNLFDFV